VAKIAGLNQEFMPFISMKNLIVQLQTEAQLEDIEPHLQKKHGKWVGEYHKGDIGITADANGNGR
jgi:hypothetical protein